MKEKFITKCGVLHNRKESFGYGTWSKYLVYSIESQAADFRTQALVIEKQLALGFRAGLSS